MNLELGGGMQPMKLRHVGMDDYLNMDPFLGGPPIDIIHDATVAPWPIGDGEVGNIYSAEFMEHISFHKLPTVLSESFRVLKSGGRFAFECPDMMGIAKNLASGRCTPEQIAYMRRGICGDQNREYDIHLNALWFEYIQPLMEKAGFINIRKFQCPLWRDDFQIRVREFGAEFMDSVKLCVEGFKP